jgi:hypothetical protein
MKKEPSMVVEVELQIQSPNLAIRVSASFLFGTTSLNQPGIGK